MGESLAQLRDAVLERQNGPLSDHEDDSYGGCVICRQYVPHTDGVYVALAFPCPVVQEYRLATALSPENVAAGLHEVKLVIEGLRHSEDNHEQDAIWLLGAIPVDTPGGPGARDALHRLSGQRR